MLILPLQLKGTGIAEAERPPKVRNTFPSTFRICPTRCESSVRADVILTGKRLFNDTSDTGTDGEQTAQMGSELRYGLLIIVPIC